MTQAAPARHRRGAYTISYPEYERLADRQAAGLSALSDLAEPRRPGVAHAPRSVRALPPHPDHRRGGNYGGHRDGGPAVLPARDGRAGHLAHEYDIPDITFRPRRWLALLPVGAIGAGSVYLHHSGLSQRVLADPVLVITWVTTSLFILLQVVLAWCQRPFKVNRRQQAELDQLRVTVVIPCYNEDPKILDRTIASLVRQTRLPDHIEVVDDGSTVDYTEIREWWLDNSPHGVRFSWVRQENAGKKHAQAVTFTSDHDAHIFVTIDSDSALDRRAIEEGLKPFADPRVVSVAGLETAINIDKNLLTRAIGHRSLVFQLFAMSAQSVARGSVLINPGAFSLYWAPLIRKIVPAYLGETFFGVPVTLGDDTALTMYALLHGRAVHQPTAVSMPVYPELLTHHLRQWTRWMRASTIRMLWRLRYLPIMSYGWWFTVYTLCALFTSVAITLAIPLAWPATETLVVASLVALVIWPWAISLRLATLKRSDQTVFNKLIGVALLPFAALWYLIVLRQMRFYGIATCWRQGWVTRQKVEVKLDNSDADPAPAVPDVRLPARGSHHEERPRRQGAYDDYDLRDRHRQPAAAGQYGGHDASAPHRPAGNGSADPRRVLRPAANGAYDPRAAYRPAANGPQEQRGYYDQRGARPAAANGSYDPRGALPAAAHGSYDQRAAYRPPGNGSYDQHPAYHAAPDGGYDQRHVLRPAANGMYDQRPAYRPAVSGSQEQLGYYDQRGALPPPANGPYDPRPAYRSTGHGSYDGAQDGWNGGNGVRTGQDGYGGYPDAGHGGYPPPSGYGNGNGYANGSGYANGTGQANGGGYGHGWGNGYGGNGRHSDHGYRFPRNGPDDYAELYG